MQMLEQVPHARAGRCPAGWVRRHDWPARTAVQQESRRAEPGPTTRAQVLGQAGMLSDRDGGDRSGCRAPGQHQLKSGLRSRPAPSRRPPPGIRSRCGRRSRRPPSRTTTQHPARAAGREHGGLGGRAARRETAARLQQVGVAHHPHRSAPILGAGRRCRRRRRRARVPRRTSLYPGGPAADLEDLWVPSLVVRRARQFDGTAVAVARRRRHEPVSRSSTGSGRRCFPHRAGLARRDEGHASVRSRRSALDPVDASASRRGRGRVVAQTGRPRSAAARRRARAHIASAATPCHGTASALPAGCPPSAQSSRLAAHVGPARGSPRCRGTCVRDL